MSIITTAISRLFDYAAGQKIKSADVDAELNMLVEAHNKVFTDVSALDTKVTSGSAALETHKASHDHDTIYYTEAETNALLATRDADLATHKASQDHNALYYLKAVVDGFVSGLNSAISAVSSALTTHKSSGDHDGRYLQPGNTTPFTPTGDYNPVHKLWTLQQIAAAVLGGIPDNSITDQKMAVGNKKQDIIDAVLPLIPDAEFQFDNAVGKNGWQYTCTGTNPMTELLTQGGTTKASRVTTFDAPLAGQITQVTTGPTGKVTTQVFLMDTNNTSNITEV